ncbi:MAG: 2OG-Fe(II) oxygenase family protein [bacterium]|nr:2OG-Fe(II) oxygenase family protein [bacterium]
MAASRSIQRMDVRTLQSRGFVAIPYPVAVRTSVQDAMQSWKNFCDLADEQKRKLCGGDRIVDFGYMRRNDKGPRADDKELFHVVGHNLTKLHALAAQVNDRRATAFIDANDVLVRETAPFIEGFARAVEKQYGLKGLEKAVAGARDNWTIRFLHYFPGSRPIFANAHADRGGYTFHCWEDQEGGEYLDFDGIWKPWPVSDTQTIIFPSMGLNFYSAGKLKALWHRVIPNETTVAKGRYAMVMFIDFNMSHRFDDSRFRMQDFEQGFNYSMPFDEFKKLFVPGKQGSASV